MPATSTETSINERSTTTAIATARTATQTVSIANPSAVHASKHADVEEHLRHLSALLRRMLDHDDDMTLRERRRLMDDTIVFVEEHIERHTREEEAVLYP